jgi:hypothetical protein
MDLAAFGTATAGYDFEHSRNLYNNNGTKLRGYVVMKAEQGVNDQELNRRFAELKSIFGNDCFSWSGKSLRIDYTENALIVTVGNPVGIDSNNINQNEFYYSDIQEDGQTYGCYHLAGGYDSANSAYRYPLDATRFVLTEESAQTNWVLYYKNSIGVYTQVTYSQNGVRLITTDSEAYLEIPEMSDTVTSNLMFKLQCSTVVDDVSTSATVYIDVLRRNYPVSMTMSCVRSPNFSLINNDGFLLSDNGQQYVFTPNITYSNNNVPNATISYVSWNFETPRSVEYRTNGQ